MDNWSCTDGNVYFNGIKLTQMEAPQAVSTERYEAPAEDSFDNEYVIAWRTTDEWNESLEYENLKYAIDHPDTCDISDKDRKRLAELETNPLVDCQDESNACDWEHPISVKEK